MTVNYLILLSYPRNSLKHKICPRFKYKLILKHSQSYKIFGLQIRFHQKIYCLLSNWHLMKFYRRASVSPIQIWHRLSSSWISPPMSIYCRGIDKSWGCLPILPPEKYHKLFLTTLLTYYINSYFSFYFSAVVIKCTTLLFPFKIFAKMASSKFQFILHRSILLKFFFWLQIWIPTRRHRHD